MFKPATSLARPVRCHVTRTFQSSLANRAYSVRSKAKEFNKLLDRIGDEKTQESQKTIKAVRMVGAGSIIIVLCSLLWASSLTAPVRETPVDVGNLATDVRER